MQLTEIYLCYRQPSQSIDELNEYMISLNIIYGHIKDEKPLVVVLAGDFNARSSLFWENDIENCEGHAFGDFVITNNLEELINEHTQLRNDGSQSCIDIICTDQPFMFTESGVLPLLDAHSKHQIVHGTLNINVPCPPPYKRKVRDYKSANSDNIRREINTTDWANLFQNRNVNEMAETFTDVFLNIISRNIGKFNYKSKEHWVNLFLKYSNDHMEALFEFQHSFKLFKLLEKFICRDYLREKDNAITLDKARWTLFKRSSAECQKLPPTHGAFVKHLRRSIIQINIWANACTATIPLLDPLQYSWYVRGTRTFRKQLWTISGIMQA